MRKTILMPIAALALACVLLLGGYNGLQGIRAEREAAELNAKLQTLLPGSTTFTEEAYIGDDANIRTTYKSEKGYVVYTVTDGYAGKIAMLVGVSNEGSVTGLQIREMSETYGLGGEALTDVGFLKQFLNTKGDAQVGENVDALTGATVTSKAVARSVNSAVAFVTGADIDSSASEWGG